MIISYDKQFLFLHIPKTAGSSVSAALRPFRNPLERSLKARIIRRIPVVKPDYHHVNFDAHPHWSSLKAKMLLPTDIFNQLYKFAFVRHPVSWHISMFKHILRHEHVKGFPERFAPVYKYRRFEDYIHWRIDLGPVPQIMQMLDLDGEMLVDFVGRYENLVTDFQHVCQKFTISANLGKLNQSPSEQAVSVTPSLRTLIIEAYQADMVAFGYTEVGLQQEWQLDKSHNYSSVAEWLPKLNWEDFNPWQVYELNCE